MSDTTKVRTTMRPDEEIEVGAQELADLRAQGLVVDTKATTPAGVRRAAEAQTAPTSEKG